MIGVLRPAGRSIDDARDAAAALQPLAGDFAAALFGAGSSGRRSWRRRSCRSRRRTPTEAPGYEGALDDGLRDAPLFYGTYVVVVVASVVIVLIPGAPLVPILFLTQALNAVLLLPLLCFILGIVRDRETMGDFALGRPGSAVAVAVIGVLAVCVASLAVALAFG